PFDTPSADLVLHTCDGVEFRVHSDLLRISSPYFDSVLSYAPSGQGVFEVDHSGRIVALTLPEHSRIIATILQYVYPVERPGAAADAQAASLLLKAAMKYEFINAIAPLQAGFLEYADIHPTAVFAIACAHHWATEARRAAIASMRLPVEGSYVEELEGVPATSYHLLLRYRKAMGTATNVFARNVMRDMAQGSIDWPWLPEFVFATDLDMPVRFIWMSCTDCKADHDSGPPQWPSRRSVRQWFCEWLRQVCDLLRITPCGRTVLDPPAFRKALRYAAACETC
ncbi:hypothetical protein FOMPIDRAFT_1078218, partial [Fomitopsis schrenkii]